MRFAMDAGIPVLAAMHIGAMALVPRLLGSKVCEVSLGKTKDIEGRVKQLRIQAEATTSDHDREKLQERLARLVGGVAVIKVGASIETEMKEKQARVEDAVHATEAVICEIPAEKDETPAGGMPHGGGMY